MSAGNGKCLYIDYASCFLGIHTLRARSFAPATIYVDLDVPCAFAKITETKVSAKAPLLLNVEGEFVFQGRGFNLYVNTDFIACAYD